MNKECFLYNYLVKYIDKEKVMKSSVSSSNVSDGWEKYDKENHTSGVVFYALRNILAHDTYNTLRQLEASSVTYEKIIDDLDKLKLDQSSQIAYIEFLIESANVEQELKKIGYRLCKFESKNNSYIVFEKKSENGLRMNIFFHSTAKFITNDVSTQNHCDSKREYYNNSNVYVESGFSNGVFRCHMSLGAVPAKAKLVVTFKKSKKILFRDFTTTEYTIMGNRLWKSYKKDDKNLLKELSNHFDITMVEEICKNVQKLYNDSAPNVKKIGVYFK